jgi:type IV secretory pathway component VirB8
MVLADCIADLAGHKYWYRSMRRSENYDDIILRRRHPLVNVQNSNLVFYQYENGINIVKDRSGKNTISDEELIWIKVSSTELID